MSQNLKRFGFGTVRFILAPVALGGLSGYVRGAEVDAMFAEMFARVCESVAIYLGSSWVHPAVAWGLVRCLQFGLFSVALLVLGWLIAGPALRMFLVISEVARRQGRKTSAVDEVIGLGLLVAGVVALTRYDVRSLMGWLFFCLAYVYIAWAFDRRRAGGLLDWLARFHGGQPIPS